MSTEQEPQYDVVKVPTKEIFADDTFNCRGYIKATDVIDLARSIAARGLDTPITIRPWADPNGKYKYKVTAGHCRLLAFEINQMDMIPAFIRPMEELEAHILNLRENVNRRDLNILQEANGLKYFLQYKRQDGSNMFTAAELGQMFNQSIGWVQVRQDLLKLPADIQKEVAAGLINQAEIKILARITNHADQQELVRKIKTKRMNKEKVDLTPSIKRESDVLKSHRRSHGEIAEMGELVYDTIGPSLVTRFIAWARGYVSTFAFVNDLKKHCEKEGLDFIPPDFMKSAASGGKAVVKNSGSKGVVKKSDDAAAGDNSLTGMGVAADVLLLTSTTTGGV